MANKKKNKQVGVRKKTGIEPYTPSILRDVYNKHVKGLNLSEESQQTRKMLNESRNKRECKNMGGVWIQGRCAEKKK